MIGNDIIDLKLAGKQSNWQRRGWLQKVFLPLEIDKILASKDPNEQVWKLWSRKEAAYKAHQRRFGLEPRYIPKKIECRDRGVVKIDGNVYQTTTRCTGDLIYSIAKVPDTRFHSEIFETAINIRTQLKKTMHSKLGNSALISFEKDTNAIPIMKINSSYSNIPFSITHHGRYTAYVVKT